MTEYVALNGGVDKFFHKGSKVTDVIQAEVFWKTNRYQIQLKEGDGRFVVAHEKLGYAAGSMIYYNDIANYTNEAGIKQYKGLKRGDYINNYLTEIKKYHSMIPARPLRLQKKAIYRMTVIICMKKEIIWQLSFMPFTRKLQLCTIVS